MAHLGKDRQQEVGESQQSHGTWKNMGMKSGIWKGKKICIEASTQITIQTTHRTQTLHLGKNTYPLLAQLFSPADIHEKSEMHEGISD